MQYFGRGPDFHKMDLKINAETWLASSTSDSASCVLVGHNQQVSSEAFERIQINDSRKVNDSKETTE